MKSKFSLKINPKYSESDSEYINARDQFGNIIIGEDFKSGSTIIWYDTSMETETPRDFESWMEQSYDVKAQFLEVFRTTKGRVHLLFQITKESIPSWEMMNTRHGRMEILSSIPEVFPSRLEKYLSK